MYYYYKLLIEEETCFWFHSSECFTPHCLFQLTLFLSPAWAQNPSNVSLTLSFATSFCTLFLFRMPKHYYFPKIKKLWIPNSYALTQVFTHCSVWVCRWFEYEWFQSKMTNKFKLLNKIYVKPFGGTFHVFRTLFVASEVCWVDSSFCIYN